MSSTRRLKPLPIPGAELARLKETLHPEYGSQVHESTGPEGEVERILIVRVPRNDPDMVNDVEQAVEYLHPGDLADATMCLLVGNVRTLQVPTQPLRDLMAARVQFDRRQCHLLRGQLAPGGHRLFKAPEDPRRLVRLAIRFPRAHVAEVDESDLLAAARDIGPKMGTPAYREVRSVYLVADQDDVRMDADLFFQDVQERWGEESERKRLAEEIVQKETARRIREESERQRLMASVRDAYAASPGLRVAVAPLKSRTTAGEWDAATPPADPQRDAMYARLDAMLGIRPGPALAAPFSAVPAAPLHGATPGAHDPLAPFPPPATPDPAAVAVAVVPQSPHVASLKAALEASGFDVLARPGAHGIDLAAERVAGFPSRLIAYCPDRLDVALAEKVIATAKELQADLALVVCADAEAEARKRLIATRARWLDPAGLGEFRL